MEVLAERRGGCCLSKRYKNTRTKIRWRCSAGHEWTSLPSSVKQGHWCDRCFDDKRRGSIERIRAIAAERGGECLSTVYPNAKTLLRFRCVKGHIWNATGNTLLSQRSWCRRCAGKAKHTLAAVRAVAKTRGGLCLSSRYDHALARLTWQCSAGHKWTAKYNSILRGSWCPHCSSYLRERLVRKVFEDLFAVDFMRVRPSWLKGPSGFSMELDGYNPKLMLAFEHQGEQHYKIVERFAASAADLLARQRADSLKRSLCRKNGVRLIEVPYTVAVANLAQFVAKECVRAGVRVPQDRSVDLSSAYPVREISELRKIAVSKGGRCLSRNYEGSEVALEWTCAVGHRWAALPYRIKAGNWCGRCSRAEFHRPGAERIFGKFLAIVKSKGGRCLTRAYKGSQTPLPLSCARGHRWSARPANVIHHGTWCPSCNKAQRVNMTDDDSRAAHRRFLL